jgi:hypothetical protein
MLAFKMNKTPSWLEHPSNLDPFHFLLLKRGEKDSRYYNPLQKSPARIPHASPSQVTAGRSADNS